ncbi:hypothetical protein COO60DRAFT_610047 [Scenedesmus sp. NREL 46B-D3]|nr:hypothetical protein COO60DRAFT_610047 [Scenedesmus sp. NREL 46B-D3]
MLSLPLPFPPNSHRCCPPPTPPPILQPCCRTSCLALVKKQHCMHATELPTSYHPPACNALDHICCVHPLYIAHNACHCIITYDLLSCSHLLPGICSDLIPADCATVTQHHIATTLHLMCSPCTVPILLHRCYEITMLLANHDAVTRRVAVDVLISLPLTKNSTTYTTSRHFLHLIQVVWCNFAKLTPLFKNIVIVAVPPPHVAEEK